MSVQNRRKESFINGLNEIIEDNLSNERSGVSELAQELNMSRSNLHGKMTIYLATLIIQ
jgi:DNA-binding NtrC family response regulator